MRTRNTLRTFQENIEMVNGCWIWKRSLRRGYARMYDETGQRVTAHVWAYERKYGKIGPGLELDHLCRKTNCVNPDHLEPVTHRENVLRGDHSSARHAKVTHCPHGHEYTEKNTYKKPNGSRQCRTCRREYHRTKRVRKQSTRA